MSCLPKTEISVEFEDMASQQTQHTIPSGPVWPRPAAGQTAVPALSKHNLGCFDLHPPAEANKCSREGTQQLGRD